MVCPSRLTPILALCVLLVVLAACNERSPANNNAPSSAAASPDTTEQGAPCDPDDGSIALPDGFCATVVADDLGTARHLAVQDDGDVYVKLRETEDGGGIVALRDTDGDYKADVTKRFGDFGGTGMALRNSHLYASSTTAVYRWTLPNDALVPQGQRQTVAGGFPRQGQHAAKSLALGGGDLYVNVGAPANACQEQSRAAGSPGQDPCPLLERHGGIWQFALGQTGQTQMENGRRFATGIRNAVALAWHPAQQQPYLVQHGRDQLRSLWPDLYTEEESAELPAEEMGRVDEGDNFGWPYCYYDQIKDQKVLAPEYGGDGSEVGRCSSYEDPVVAFPGHWAPNSLHFYTGDQFPDRYRGGAFVAFHGSWNRAPKPQAGYRVSFAPFEGGEATGEYETFADGFSGSENLGSPSNAEYRPMGLAQGPDGALYLSDSTQGRIWRITYTGDK
jgi:glucose/arabinose dehydrogenase